MSQSQTKKGHDKNPTGSTRQNPQGNTSTRNPQSGKPHAPGSKTTNPTKK